MTGKTLQQNRQVLVNFRQSKDPFWLANISVLVCSIVTNKSKNILILKAITILFIRDIIEFLNEPTPTQGYGVSLLANSFLSTQESGN